MSSSEGDWKQFLEELGYYAVSFSLEPKSAPSLKHLRSWIQNDEPRYTGWSPFWWPSRSEIAPKVIDQNTYECLHDGTGVTGHIERWRASTTGRFTIVRALDSDRMHDEPGKYLELTLPVWRVAELLLYAGRMAEKFGSATVSFTLRYDGLKGRVIATRAAPNRMLTGEYTTGAERYERRVALTATDIDSSVIDITDDLIRGLFELFQFDLPASLCEVEIERMKSNRF